MDTIKTTNKDPLGVHAWAHSHGLPHHVALALASTTLANVAGSAFRLNISPGRGAGMDASGIQRVSVACREGDLAVRSALADLVGPLSHAQRLLLAKAREYTAEEIRDALYQRHPAFGRPDALEDLRTTGGNYKNRSTFEQVNDISTQLTVSEKIVLFDEMTRPRFLLEGTLPARLQDLLRQCHGGHAFAGGTVEVLPGKKAEINKRVNDLLRCMRGLEIPTQQKSHSTPVGHESISIGGVFVFPAADFSKLISDRRDFFSHALPLAPGIPIISELEDLDAEAKDVQWFVNRFYRTACRAIGSRRCSATLDAFFHRQSSVNRFRRLHMEFLASNRFAGRAVGWADPTSVGGVTGAGAEGVGVRPLGTTGSPCHKS